ncbi:MAG TPA: NUDIX domain-containing protein [Candidatus Limnocylindrales bacterium]|nr:NUDIX domain-containing protein [Candidatus Limnocylindrales bacterium]
MTAPAAPGDRAVPRLAATVVLLRPSAARGPAEVLLIHRPDTMAFGPGLHAFPGGKVDEEDASAPALDRPDELTGAAADERLATILGPRDALAVHRTAVREAAEEVGVVLRPAELAPIALWTTPPFMPRRYATWFFVADLPAGAELAFEPAEVAAHRWLTARDALEARAERAIDMWVPTTSVLERLVELDVWTAAEVRARIRIRRPDPPAIVAATDGSVTIALGSTGGTPGRPGRAELIGRRAVVVVDPGDQTEESIDFIGTTAAQRGSTIRAVVLTRPDPDHAAGAEALATPLGIPVLVAPGAGRWLPYETVTLTDGELLPTDVPASVRLGPPGSGELSIVLGSAR